MKLQKKAKCAVATAAALALSVGMAFGETHETLKAHTLETSVGDISFGAWGRSTFEFGHRSNSTNVKVEVNSTGTNATAEFQAAAAAYEAAKADGTLSAVNTAVTGAAAAAGITGVEDAAEVTYDGTNFADYAAAVATYTGYAAGLAAVNSGSDLSSALATAGSVGAQVGDYATKYATVLALQPEFAKYATDGTVTDTSNYAALNPDWSYGNRIGFWIIGRTPDEKFGFDFNLDADARALFVHKLWDSTESTDDTNYNEDGKYAVAIGDQAKMWGIFDGPLGLQNKVAFGKMREQTLRGTIGDFGQRESSDVKSEDDIMSEFWPTTGFYVSTTGKEDSMFKGFHAAAAIDLSGTLGTTSWKNGTSTSGTYTGYSAGDTDNDYTKSEMPLYYAMRTGQAGIGYTIPGIAQIKAQYWGDSIAQENYRYEVSKYKTARDAGYGLNDYYGRMEFAIDWLGFMGGATSFLDPALDLEKTPNANLIEWGFKVPIVTREGLRDYDPEKFYNWYSCLGTMGVIKQGFILYKGHIWGGQGTSNLSQYTDVNNSGSGLVDMAKGDGASIFMAGIDFLAEMCINPFGKQDLFLGLSGNYNITSASADGNTKTDGLYVSDLELRQHKFAAELYFKKTFASNNFMFAGLAGNFSISTMEGTVNDVLDMTYKAVGKKFYMPIGVELFF